MRGLGKRNFKLTTGETLNWQWENFFFFFGGGGGIAIGLLNYFFYDAIHPQVTDDRLFVHFCIADKSAVCAVVGVCIIIASQPIFSFTLWPQPVCATGKWPILGFTAKQICIFSSKYAKHKPNFWDGGTTQSTKSPWLSWIFREISDNTWSLFAVVSSNWSFYEICSTIGKFIW